jgi:hypothetical protein
VVVAVALVVAWGAHVASSPALVIGIADQKPDMFADPLFRSMQIGYARIAISWDAMEHPWEVAEVDQWLQAARADGVQPLVGFGHSRVDRRALPTPSRYKYDFELFRRRYPWVTTFATWNEANHCGEPTCHRPQLVSAYYRGLVRACPKCTILGAELLDMPNMSSWVDAFRRQLGRTLSPRYWGLHNYIDANRLRTDGTRRLLAHTTGQIWFTETGGIVKRTNAAKVTFPESAAHAAVATRWVFQRLVPLSRRITRVYLYQWNAAKGDTWDSGLLDPHGRQRPALAIVKAEQKTLLRRAARRAKAGGPPPGPPPPPAPAAG